MMEETTTTIMAALATLTPSQLSDLTTSISSDLHLHRRRLSAILSSPPLFFLTLHRLYLLSLPAKSHLISKLLLSSLRRLTLHHHHHHHHHHPTCHSLLKPRDLDAVLLLLLLCDVSHHTPHALHTPPFRWREALAKVYVHSMLTAAGSGIGSPAAAIVPYIETTARCLRFVGNTSTSTGSNVNVREGGGCGGGGAAVGGGRGRGGVRDMQGGDEGRRDVCGLPCQHKFHWRCVLPWLRRRNTCPSCRSRLPTGDVFAEIQQLWDILIKMSGVAKAGFT